MHAVVNIIKKIINILFASVKSLLQISLTKISLQFVIDQGHKSGYKHFEKNKWGRSPQIIKTVTSSMEPPPHFPRRCLPHYNPPPSPAQTPPLSTSYHHDVPHHHRIGFTGNLQRHPCSSTPLLADTCLFHAANIFAACEVKIQGFLKFSFNCYLLLID